MGAGAQTQGPAHISAWFPFRSPCTELSRSQQYLAFPSTQKWVFTHLGIAHRRIWRSGMSVSGLPSLSTTFSNSVNKVTSIQYQVSSQCQYSWELKTVQCKLTCPKDLQAQTLSKRKFAGAAWVKQSHERAVKSFLPAADSPSQIRQALGPWVASTGSIATSPCAWPLKLTYDLQPAVTQITVIRVASPRDVSCLYQQIQPLEDVRPA